MAAVFGRPPPSNRFNGFDVIDACIGAAVLVILLSILLYGNR